jgi:beta-lactam-binding protein with PASTA domain
MRRSHGFLLLLVLIALVAFAWWRNWFSVNKENVKQDVNQGAEKAKEVIKEGTDKLKEGVDKIKGNPKDSK